MAKYTVSGLVGGTWSEHSDVKAAYHQMMHNYRWAKRMGWTTRIWMFRIFNGGVEFTATSTRVIG